MSSCLALLIKQEEGESHVNALTLQGQRGESTPYCPALSPQKHRRHTPLPSSGEAQLKWLQLSRCKLADFNKPNGIFQRRDQMNSPSLLSISLCLPTRQWSSHTLIASHVGHLGLLSSRRREVSRAQERRTAALHLWRHLRHYCLCCDSTVRPVCICITGLAFISAMH